MNEAKRKTPMPKKRKKMERQYVKWEGKSPAVASSCSVEPVNPDDSARESSQSQTWYSGLWFEQVTRESDVRVFTDLSCLFGVGVFFSSLFIKSLGTGFADEHFPSIKWSINRPLLKFFRPFLRFLPMRYQSFDLWPSMPRHFRYMRPFNNQMRSSLAVVTMSNLAAIILRHISSKDRTIWTNIQRPSPNSKLNNF